MPESANKNKEPESAATPWSMPEILRAWQDKARERTGLAIEVEYDETWGSARVHDRDELYPTRDVIAASPRSHEGGRFAVRRLCADGAWRDVTGADGNTRLWACLLDAAAECFDALLDQYAAMRRAHIEGLAR